MSSYLMTRQGNLNRSQVLPWCQFLVHITDSFAQDGLMPAALVPSSQTFRWIRCPHQLDSPKQSKENECIEAEAAGARSEDVVVERLGRAISALQHHRGHRRKLATVISNRWNHADHDNSLQLQTHLASLRSRTRMQHAVRSLHDLDSQVAWGILTKNRSSSLRFCRVVIKCIVPCLTVSYFTLLEYSCTAEHPADRASRAHEDVDDQSAGQSRGDISMNSWNDFEAATKIEVNYVSRVLYYQLQLKGKVHRLNKTPGGMELIGSTCG